MTTPGPFVRLARRALLVGAAAAALALAGPDALRPFADVAGAAGGEAFVAFVIDFGGGRPPLVACVKVPAGDDGYQALASFSPRFADSGLLCAIDGIPATGCGTQTPQGYEYWSYFTGSGGSWTYASTGAFAVPGTTVQGWRFQDPGPDNATAPAPRATPTYAAICTATVIAPTTTTAPATGGATATTAPPAGGRAVTTTTGPGAATTTTAAPAGATTTTGPAAAAVAPATTTTSAPGGVHVVSGILPADPDRGGRGGPLPLLLGAGLALAIGALAWWQWRRRGATP